MVGIFLPSSKYGKVQLVTKNSPFRWKRGWSWPCFDKTLPALLCKCCSHANQYFLSKIYIRKGRRFVSNKVNLTFTQRLRHLKPTTVKWPIRGGDWSQWEIFWMNNIVAYLIRCKNTSAVLFCLFAMLSGSRNKTGAKSLNPVQFFTIED